MRRFLALLAAVIFSFPAFAQPMLTGAGVYATSGGCAYTTQACALFAQMTSSPDSTRKGLIDTAISCMISNGSWAKEDWLVVMAAGNSHDGLLNWVAPAKTLSIGGSLTFTTDRGFQLTTSGGSPPTDYLLMPELLNAAGNNYALNDAHFSAYMNLFAFKGFGSVINSGATGGAANTSTSLTQFDSTNSFWSQINVANGTPGLTTGVDATTANYIGMWAVTRTASNAQAMYKSGLPVNLANSWTSSVNSTAIPTTAPRLLWGDNAVAFGPPATGTRLAVYSTGTKFANSTEAGNESSCITTYLAAIGAS